MRLRGVEVVKCASWRVGGAGSVVDKTVASATVGRRETLTFAVARADKKSVNVARVRVRLVVSVATAACVRYGLAVAALGSRLRVGLPVSERVVA